MALEYNTFVRKPFVVEAVEVTEENIEGIAEKVGQVETKADGTKYIAVDRRIVPNIYRVYPGFFMTKLGDNYRCYSKRIFDEQFVIVDDSISEAVSKIKST